MGLVFNDLLWNGGSSSENQYCDLIVGILDEAPLSDFAVLFWQPEIKRRQVQDAKGHRSPVNQDGRLRKNLITEKTRAEWGGKNVMRDFDVGGCHFTFCGLVTF